jgi:hypothetical protein
MNVTIIHGEHHGVMTLLEKHLNKIIFTNQKKKKRNT